MGMLRLGAIAITLTLTLAGTGCGPQEPTRELSGHVIPELRFAGVDLVYAVRRAGSEAGLLVVLDEVRPRTTGWEDLGFARVDVDLPAGPIEDALDELKESVSGAFDYRIDGELLLVRSSLSFEQQTILDEPILPAATIEADLYGLIQFIQNSVPNSAMRMGARVGQPVLKKVTIEVAEGSSIMELYKQYARAVPSGLRIRRAGFDYEGQTGLPSQPGQKFVVANTIGLWSGLDAPTPLPIYRTLPSAIWSLASVAERTGTPIVVFDRSLMLDNVGSLSHVRRKDRGLDMQEALDKIAWQGEGVRPEYGWSDEDGVIKVVTHHFNYFLTGHELMEEPLRAGSFEGALGDLVRWLNANRKSDSPKMLMGGEIAADASVAKLEIAEDTTVGDALVQFSRASGEGVNVVLRDGLSPREPLEGTWSGAFVTRLPDWGPSGIWPAAF